MDRHQPRLDVESRREEKPPSRIMGGGPLDYARGEQLKLGLKGEARPQRLRVAMVGAVRKETLLEELFAFAKGFLFYIKRRLFGVLRLLWRTFASGFIFSSGLKSHLQGKLYRKKGQLAFPLAHASLLTISFSLLIFTSGLGERLKYQQTSGLTLEEGAAIVADQPSVATEESKLLQTEVQTYIVQEGDTLYSIAEQFLGMTPDALAYANNINNPFQALRPGEELIIPPIEGLVYKVRVGDTIELIAKRYQTEPMDIVEFNYLFPPYKLAAGQELVIPYAQVPGSQTPGGFLTSIPSSTGACGPLTLSWPTARQDVLGGHGCYYNELYGDYICHLAIDLRARDEVLYAVQEGTVVAAGRFPGQCFSFSRECNYGYGGYVFIDIGNGYQVRYGHISKPLVGVGEKVFRGDPVAVSGDTGYSLGPHLHFELLCNGKKINPLPYLSK